MLLICGVLGLTLLPHFLNPKRLKKFQKTIGAFSAPPRIDAPLDTVFFDVEQVPLAVQIIQGWFPREETEFMEGAPAGLHGRLIKDLHYREGKAEIELNVFYRATPFRRDSGSLFISMEEVGGNLKVSYSWSGADTAITDMFCTDYAVLHYLIERTEKGFLDLNYHKLEKQMTAASSPKAVTVQAKQWWRTFNASECERVYSHWPTPQDYLEAVQNPVQNFHDDGLKKCLPELNKMGIPKVASGMFASVYEFKGEQEQWAVRCFTSRLKDQQERYKAISSFILADDLPYTVDFHYLEDGIRCGDEWFPILKMVWVEGQTLEAFVKDNLRNFNALNHLRSEFATMMEKLKANGVAHGDLQHGNILISKGQIFLVDYDGFFVPELAGRHNNELGHPNYQHPKRTEKYFGPYLDNFSAQLIDTSILCLIEDPFLWQNFNGGDECLLFRHQDLVDPDNSKLVKALKNHGSVRVREAVDRFLSYLKLPLEEIPYLSNEDGSAEKLQISEPQPIQTE